MFTLIHCAAHVRFAPLPWPPDHTALIPRFHIDSTDSCAPDASCSISAGSGVHRAAQQPLQPGLRRRRPQPRLPVLHALLSDRRQRRLGRLCRQGRRVFRLWCPPLPRPAFPLSNLPDFRPSRLPASCHPFCRSPRCASFSGTSSCSGCVPGQGRRRPRTRTRPEPACPCMLAPAPPGPNTGIQLASDAARTPGGSRTISTGSPTGSPPDRHRIATR